MVENFIELFMYCNYSNCRMDVNLFYYSVFDNCYYIIVRMFIMCNWVFDELKWVLYVYFNWLYGLVVFFDIYVGILFFGRFFLFLRFDLFRWVVYCI